MSGSSLRFFLFILSIPLALVAAETKLIQKIGAEKPLALQALTCYRGLPTKTEWSDGSKVRFSYWATTSGLKDMMEPAKIAPEHTSVKTDTLWNTTRFSEDGKAIQETVYDEKGKSSRREINDPNKTVEVLRPKYWQSLRDCCTSPACYDRYQVRFLEATRPEPAQPSQ